MSPYAFSLALGVMGLAAMAAIGLGSHAHHGGGGGHEHGGHGHGGHGHGHGGQGHGHHTAGHAHHEPAALRVAAVLSPRLWFTLLAGFGATGMLVRPLVAGGPLRAVLAVAGALLFEALLARPLWNFAFRFESRPATTLEACVEDEVQAVTGFDRDGHGLIAVELDGQVVQVLATLRAADRAAGVRVRAGDRVRVEEVDPARNRCVVSALGS
jgi:translation initiation factor IF-1